MYDVKYSYQNRSDICIMKNSVSGYLFKIYYHEYSKICISLWVTPLGPASLGNYLKVCAIVLLVLWPLKGGNWESLSLRAIASRADRGELSCMSYFICM